MWLPDEDHRSDSFGSNDHDAAEGAVDSSTDVTKMLVDDVFTLYAVLGVEQDALFSEIEQAYLEVVASTDSDASPELLDAVQEAYEVLSDPLARGAYDQHLDAVAAAQQREVEAAQAAAAAEQLSSGSGRTLQLADRAKDWVGQVASGLAELGQVPATMLSGLGAQVRAWTVPLLTAAVSLLVGAAFVGLRTGGVVRALAGSEGSRLAVAAVGTLTASAPLVVGLAVAVAVMLVAAKSFWPVVRSLPEGRQSGLLVRLVAAVGVSAVLFVEVLWLPSGLVAAALSAVVLTVLSAPRIWQALRAFVCVLVFGPSDV